jgi:hypothetical protein
VSPPRSPEPPPPPDDPGFDAEAGFHLQVISALYGGFPEVRRLNPEFIPGMRRLKLTIRIPAGDNLPSAETLFGILQKPFPSLGRHRCCGANSIGETFFTRGQRQGCSIQEWDPGVDLAHLLEHLIIDIQHFIARMKICSGVTCAYREPRDMYDIFVECPDEKVGLLSASIAVGLVSDLLAMGPADPHYRCIMEVSRHGRDNAGRSILHRLDPLETKWGAEAVSEAVDYLKLQGFLTEGPAAVSGGEAMLAYNPAS